MTIHAKRQDHMGNAAGWTEADIPPALFAARLMALANAFEEHGRDILWNLRQDGPVKLWFFVSGFLDCEDAIDLGWEPSDDDLDRLLERIVAALRAGTPDDGKCRH
ncbi:MAG: hypothetical protein JSR91_25715 [Proteobacteria bacterium]|nr:hypothetical protein [Pseudomonadota bacterium]